MTPSLRKAIMERDHYTCQLCGKYMPDEVGLHIDHIVPIAKDGKSVPSNLRVLCSKCNGKKGSRWTSHTTFAYFYLDSAPFGYSLASKGYKKDVAQETPDFIGGFAVSTAEKTTSDFVDVKKILFPFWNELNSHTTEYPQSSAWINQVHTLFLFPLKGGKRCERKPT